MTFGAFGLVDVCSIGVSCIKDKSLAMHPRDLIFFTNDLKTQEFTARADLFLKHY